MGKEAQQLCTTHHGEYLQEDQLSRRIMLAQ